MARTNGKGIYCKLPTSFLPGGLRAAFIREIKLHQYYPECFASLKLSSYPRNSLPPISVLRPAMAHCPQTEEQHGHSGVQAPRPQIYPRHLRGTLSEVPRRGGRLRRGQSRGFRRIQSRERILGPDRSPLVPPLGNCAKQPTLCKTVDEAAITGVISCCPNQSIYGN